MKTLSRFRLRRARLRLRRAKSQAAIAFAVGISVVAGSIAIPAGAADAEDNKKIATDLFDKGVKAMTDGHCDETPITDEKACREARENFRRAYALYPAALGALRNLAYTEKGLGLVASASRNFRELARRAPLDPKPERHAWAEFAKREADVLEGLIPHLIVKMPSDRPIGTKVFLDGAPLQEAAWGTQIDTDPGTHEVRAEAPGRLKFVGSVALAQKQTKSISVVLDVDKGSGSNVSSNSRVAPIIVASVGLAGVGVGLGLGYASMKKRDSACNGTKICEPQGLSDGKSLANATTIVTGIGTAVLVGGVVWFLLAPGTKTEERSTASIVPYAGPEGAGLAAFGHF